MKKIRYTLHISIIIIVFLFTIIISVIPASSGDPLDRVVEILAQREISENELDEALSIVKDVLNKEPDNPKALYYAGRVYMVRKEYDIAIKQFQKALSLEKRGSSYLCLGLCYKNKEQPDLYKAKECFKNARELFIMENDNPEFYENTLRELVSITSGYEQDKYKEELQNFLDSGKRIPTPAPTPTPTRTPTPTSTPTPTRTPTPTPTPHPALVHCDRGAEYLSRKKYDEAIKEYEEALSINSSIAEAWYNLGVIWDLKGDKEKSMENFKKYLEVKPDADDRYEVECIILMLQGEIYYTQGRYWKAIETFQQVVNLDPAHVSAYFNLGMSYDKVQKYEAATEAYEKAVTAEPGNASAHYNLAVHYEYLGRNSEAVKHYKEYLRLSPDAEDKEEVEKKIRKLD